MASKCINLSHPEFIALSQQSDIHPAILAADVNLWQEANDTDEFPTEEQLRNFQTEETSKELGQQTIDDAAINNDLFRQKVYDVAINRGATVTPDGIEFTSRKQAKRFTNSTNRYHSNRVVEFNGNKVTFTPESAMAYRVDQPIAEEDMPQRKDPAPKIELSSLEQVGNLTDLINYSVEDKTKHDPLVEKWFDQWAAANGIRFDYYEQTRKLMGKEVKPQGQASRYRRFILFASKNVGWRTMTEEAIHMALYALWQSDNILQQIKDSGVLQLSKDHKRIYAEHLSIYVEKESGIKARIAELEEEERRTPGIMKKGFVFEPDPLNPLREHEVEREMPIAEYIKNLKGFLHYLSPNKSDLAMMEVLAKEMTAMVRDEIHFNSGSGVAKVGVHIVRIFRMMMDQLQRLWDRAFNSASATDQRRLKEWIRMTASAVANSKIDLKDISNNPPPGYNLLNTTPVLGTRISEAKYFDLLNTQGVAKLRLEQYLYEKQLHLFNVRVPIAEVLRMESHYEMTTKRALSLSKDLATQTAAHTIDATGLHNFNYVFTSRSSDVIELDNYMGKLGATLSPAEVATLTNLMRDALRTEKDYLTLMSDPNTRKATIATLREQGKNYVDFARLEQDYKDKQAEFNQAAADYEADPTNAAILNRFHMIETELDMYDNMYVNLGIRQEQGTDLKNIRGLESRISKFKELIRKKQLPQAIMWFVLGTDSTTSLGQVSDYSNMAAQLNDIIRNIEEEQAELSKVVTVNGITEKHYQDYGGDQTKNYADTPKDKLFDKFDYKKWSYYRQYVDFNHEILQGLANELNKDEPTLELSNAQRIFLKDTISGYTDGAGVRHPGLLDKINEVKAYVETPAIANRAIADYIFRYSNDPVIRLEQNQGESDNDFLLRQKKRVVDAVDFVYKDRGTWSTYMGDPLDNADPLIGAVYSEIFKVVTTINKQKAEENGEYYRGDTELSKALSTSELARLAGKDVSFTRFTDLLIEHVNGRPTKYMMQKYNQHTFMENKKLNEQQLREDTEAALRNWGYINFNRVLALAPYADINDTPNRRAYTPAELAEIQDMLSKAQTMLSNKYGIANSADISDIWEKYDATGNIDTPYVDVKNLLDSSPLIKSIIAMNNHSFTMPDYDSEDAKTLVDSLYGGHYVDEEFDPNLGTFLKYLKTNNKNKFNAANTESQYTEDSWENVKAGNDEMARLMNINGDPVGSPSQATLTAFYAWQTANQPNHLRDLIAQQRKVLGPAAFDSWFKKNIQVRFDKDVLLGTPITRYLAKGSLRVPSTSTGTVKFKRLKTPYKDDPQNPGTPLEEHEYLNTNKESYRNATYDRLMSNPAFKAYYDHHIKFYKRSIRRIDNPTSILARPAITASVGEVFNIGKKLPFLRYGGQFYYRTLTDKLSKLWSLLNNTYKILPDDKMIGGSIKGYSDSVGGRQGKKPIRYLDTHYLTELDKASDYTMDITGSLAKFNDMALSYHIWGANIKKISEMEDLVGNRLYTTQHVSKGKYKVNEVLDKNYFSADEVDKHALTAKYESESYQSLVRDLTMQASGSEDVLAQRSKGWAKAVKILTMAKGWLYIVSLMNNFISQGMASLTTVVNVSRQFMTGGRTKLWARHQFIESWKRIINIGAHRDGEARDLVQFMAEQAMIYKADPNRGNMLGPQILGKLPMIGFEFSASLASTVTTGILLDDYKYRLDRNKNFRWMTDFEYKEELSVLKQKQLSMQKMVGGAINPEWQELTTYLNLAYSDKYNDAGTIKKYTSLKQVYNFVPGARQPFKVNPTWRGKFNEADLTKFLMTVNVISSTAEDQPNALDSNYITNNIFGKIAFALFRWTMPFARGRLNSKQYVAPIGFTRMGDITAIKGLIQDSYNNRSPLYIMSVLFTSQSIDPVLKRNLLGVPHTILMATLMVQMFNALRRWCQDEGWLCNIALGTIYRSALETAAKASPIVFAQQFQLNMALLGLLVKTVDAINAKAKEYGGDPEFSKKVKSGYFFLSEEHESLFPDFLADMYRQEPMSKASRLMYQVSPLNNIMRYGLDKKSVESMVRYYQFRTGYYNETAPFWLGISPFTLSNVFNQEMTEDEIKRDEKKKLSE